MPGRGPAPKQEGRRNWSDPIRGDWHAAEGVGWQHGPIPPVPSGLLPESRLTWRRWFKSWAAAHWHPDDVPQLRHTIRLYNACLLAATDPVIWPPEGSDAKPVQRRSPDTELRQMMDNMGITPKGQQDRRWLRPEVPKRNPDTRRPAADPYAGLRIVDGET